jgi:hypothetical protein
MRILTDSTGTQWTVFEVKRQSNSTDRWTYLPEEFGDGWLCFESDVSKRRLTPVPPRWREYGDDQLARMLEQALPVNRPRPTKEERADDRS